ncbi:hypothetical protein M446_4833 [Methylobacterium sp. 4-46]|uniref:hypothetical protein n=1 Tax=unclassified Methylobacterium TaxID=2615210 RepID=UPI000152E541|nr:MULTISPECIES: hypothetical protein [Methylobacterium]ACA19163.1 hypothetical protein M446_4833 [Methylobacterium sp. 4-46]WFT78371.1 hypothetical protein QA634_24290 [Methylobacterium nodulans]
MWRLLTGGIKAMLVITGLSLAAHWAARREEPKGPALAATIRDPATTGALPARRRPAGLDQRGLQRLLSDTAR